MNTDNNTPSVCEARKHVLDQANDALKAKLGWIIDWQRTETSRGILGRWDLGEEIDEIYEDARKNSGRIYGPGAKSAIALFLQEDPSIVNVAHKIYKTFPTRVDLVRLTECTMKDGVTHLSYSHIRQLITVRDTDARESLVEQCLANCWTSARLGDAIQEMYGGTRTNNPNGRAAVPKGAEGVINQMISFADDFESRNVRVWGNNTTSLSSQIDKLQPAQYTEELAKKLGELAHRMQQLAEEAVARANEAQAKYQQVLATLNKGSVKSMAELKPITVPDKIGKKRPSAIPA